MELSDLLVSYNQVRVPDKVELPEITSLSTYSSDYPIVAQTSEPKKQEEQKEKQEDFTSNYYISTIKAPGMTSVQRKWSSPYKDKNEWATELSNSYRKAGVTNENAIKMLVAQDALESGWGRSAQGKFNFGNLTTGKNWKGNYVQGNDHDANGKSIKQKFRSYNSMDEYAKDKVQFLKRLYDFDENDNITTFTSKLSGQNKGGRRYAEARNYATSLTSVFNSFRVGGILRKYLN